MIETAHPVSGGQAVAIGCLYLVMGVANATAGYDISSLEVEMKGTA